MQRLSTFLLLCTLPLLAFAQTTVFFEKIRTAPADWSGEYLIVKEVDSLSQGIVFDGALSTTLDTKHNCFRVSITTDDRIEANDQTNAATFTITRNANGTYAIRSASGYYIGYNKADSANLKFDTTPKYANSIQVESDTTTKVKITATGGYVLRYNADPTSDRFRYYVPGKKKGIHLYRKVVASGIDDHMQTTCQTIDGKLYLLPEGFYIQDGKLIYKRD